MKRHRTLRAVRIFGLIIYLIVAVFPLTWIVLTSLKPATEVYTFPVKYFPSRLTFEAYRYLFGFAKFHIYFRNSFLVAVCSALLSTTFSLMGGYILPRFRFLMRHFLLLSLFFVQMIPAYLLMISQFTMFSKLRLTNSLFGIVVIYTGLGVAFGTIMTRVFLKSIPKEMEEAAWIDGCTRFGALFRVVLPVFLPNIGAVFSFCFVNSWNEVFTAVLFLHSDHKMTVPVALYSFVSKAGIQWNVMAAGIFVALLPTVFVFAVAQKYIVSGLTQGALKG